MYQDPKKGFWWKGIKKDIAQFFSQMFDMSENLDKTPEASRTTTIFGNPRMEVGKYIYGFYNGITKDHMGA
jgi:hypothetical protein